MRRLSYLVMFSIIALVALATTAGAQGSQQQTVSTQEASSQDTQGSQQAGSTQTNPCEEPEHSNFVKEVDNKFFPLTPGTTFYYEGREEGVRASNVVSVTDAKKEILGVSTTVVHDQVFKKGVLSEDTFDWYAQAKDGTVCYFGEDTKELDKHGNVISTEGSWEAGVNGAKPGIIMEANPQVGDTYQQEFAPGIGEDMAKVLSLDKSACVPYGCFDNLLLTKEWTPLEPGVVEHKYYAKNIGFIREVTVKGGKERSNLVSITTGG